MRSLISKIPYRKLYIYFLLLLVFGVSLSKVLMSISVIALSINWIFEGNFKEKIKINKSHNYAPLILSLAFLVELIWLLKSEDLSDGISDLRIKLPMLLLPLIIGTSKTLSSLELQKVIYSFFLGLIVSSLLIFGADIGLIPSKNQTGTFRDISLFMSHIRYSALISFGIILLMRLMGKTNHKAYSVILVFWFLFILYILQSLTGVICLVLSSFLFLIIKILKQGFKKNYKQLTILFVSIIAVITYTTFIYIDYNKTKDTYSLSSLPLKTKYGEKYVQDTTNQQKENGNYLWINIAPKEVEKSWNERSNTPFDANDDKSQPLKYTLYRYLTSKGLNKDREGVMALTTQDINRIKQGETTYMNYNLLENRLRGVFFELNNYKKIKKSNNHSLTQRITFLHVAKQIIKENFFLGKGTGGTKQAYREYYINEQQGLSHKNQLRAHNQFITEFINIGLIGFLIWITSLSIPVFLSKQKDTLIYFPFLIIITINFLADDMLERQAGVTIFTLINSLLLFGIMKTPENYSSEP